MHEVYPFKFEPIYKEKIWGDQKLRTVLNKNIPEDKKIGESWEISAVQGDTSIVKNGYLAGNSLQELIEVYMADLVGEKIYETYGIEFPLLIKFIDATDVYPFRCIRMMNLRKNGTKLLVKLRCGM